jgi:hypothetical protein
MRIFYSCDFHGSESVWKKALHASIYYAADIIMICGDLTGKALVPIIRIKNNE